MKPELSVVLPVFNEIESLPELRRRLLSVLETCGRTYEIVFVDDGSRDGSFERMAEFAREDRPGHWFPPLAAAWHPPHTDPPTAENRDGERDS